MAIKIGKNNGYFYTKKRNQEDRDFTLLLSTIFNANRQGDTELEEVEFGENITQISPGVFKNCTSLTIITFHKSLRRIGLNAFAGCTGLQKIVFPDSLEEVDCWLDGRVTKITLFDPSSDELIENLIEGYTMDLHYFGDSRNDYWD